MLLHIDGNLHGSFFLSSDDPLCEVLHDAPLLIHTYVRPAHGILDWPKSLNTEGKTVVAEPGGCYGRDFEF